jgi:carbamoylphosphate synthase large subunit
MIDKLNYRKWSQTEEAANRMGENLCQLYIWQEINNQNLQRTEKIKFPKNQWPSEEMGKWTEQSFSKEKVNGQKYMKKCSTPLAIK